MKDIRIATIIFNSIVGNTIDNFNRTVYWIKKAKEKNAQFICFPELNITGYCTDQNLYPISEKIPNKFIDNLICLAQELNIVILIGMAEKYNNDKNFASHLILKPNGELNIYRKFYIAPPERSAFIGAENMPTFEAFDVKFGVQLCYDAHFPELSTYMALKGVEIIFIPHASPRGSCQSKYKSWMRHLTARAYDNSVFIVACNQVGNNNVGLNFPGISLVIGPSGYIIDENLSGKESMLISDLNAEEFYKIRDHKIGFFMKNKRPEIFKKILDEF